MKNERKTASTAAVLHTRRRLLSPHRQSFHQRRRERLWLSKRASERERERERRPSFPLVPSFSRKYVSLDRLAYTCSKTHTHTHTHGEREMKVLEHIKECMEHIMYVYTRICMRCALVGLVASDHGGNTDRGLQVFVAVTTATQIPLSPSRDDLSSVSLAEFFPHRFGLISLIFILFS